MPEELYSDKFRPIEERQLVGETQLAHIKQLKKSVDSGNPIRKVLFIGGSGTGKTTLSEMYIRYILNLKSEDNPRNHLSGYVNCTSDTGIDNMRDMISRFPYKALGEKYRIYFLDELHGLSKAAQGSLLTPIENLPSHVIVLAATTEKSKILETLHSRFLICEIHPPTRKDYLKIAAGLAGYHKAELQESDIDEIISRSGSNIRLFVNFVQQLIEGSYSKATGEYTENNLISLLLFSGEKDLHKIFNATKNQVSYSGLCVQLSRAAISSIRNPRTPRSSYNNLSAALSIFGGGLKNRTDEEAEFHQLLLKYLALKN